MPQAKEFKPLEFMCERKGRDVLVWTFISEGAHRRTSLPASIYNG